MRRPGRVLLVALLVVSACAGDDEGRVDAAAAAGDAAVIDAEADNATYRAFALATALDRIAILRADDETDTCALIRLVSPAGTGGSFGIATPENWDVEMAGVSTGSADCFADTFTAPEVGVTGGSGQVVFTIEAGAFYPSTLSIDAMLSFEAMAPIQFTASDLAVE